LLLFEEAPALQMDMMTCPGCEKKNPSKHNGHYAMIKDWETGRVQKFVETIPHPAILRR
jgi:transposase